MRQGELNRLLNRAVARWHRLGQPLTFILRDKAEGKKVEVAVRVEWHDVEPGAVRRGADLTLYSAGGRLIGKVAV